MMHRRLLSTTAVFNAPDLPAGGAAAAEPVVAAPAAAAADPSPAGAAPAPTSADAVIPSQTSPDAPAEGPAAGEPAKLDAHAEPSLLEKALEPANVDDPAKPAEAPKPAEAAKTDADPKPAEPAPIGDPPPELKYDFKLPEGVQADPAVMTKVTDVLKTAGVAPEIAQQLVDTHFEQFKAYQQNVEQSQHKAWADTRKAWRDEVTADSEIGGAGHQTAMSQIAVVRDRLLTTPQDREAFSHFLRVTGAGDNPAFLKMLYRASKFIAEPTIPGVQPKPPATNGQKPGRQGRGLQSIYAATAEARAAQ